MQSHAAYLRQSRVIENRKIISNGQQNILISGAGIAGVTLAYWLKEFGFNPTIVEQAPKLHQGGYAIDFWGAGFTVAERMGILPDLEDADLKIPEVTVVDEKRKRKCGINYTNLKNLMNGRAFTLLRNLANGINLNLNWKLWIYRYSPIHALKALALSLLMMMCSSV